MNQRIIFFFSVILLVTGVLFFLSREALFKWYVQVLLEKNEYHSLINLLEKQPVAEREPQWYVWYLRAQSVVLDSSQFQVLVRRLSGEGRKALEGLGDFYKEQADWKNAYNFYQRGLSVSDSPSLRKKYQQVKTILSGIQFLSRGRTCYYKGMLDSAEGYYEMALQKFEATGEETLILKTKYNLILVREDAGKLTDVKTAYQKFLSELEGKKQTVLEINVLNNLAIALKEEGDIPTARRFLLRSLQLTEIHQDLEGQAMVWVNLGNIAEIEGDNSAAVSAYNNAIQIAKQNGFTRLLSEALWNVSMVQLNSGNFREALRQMKYVLAVDNQQVDSIGLCYDYFGLGKIYWKMGLLGEALKHLEQSLKLQELIKYIHLKSSTIAQIGMVYQKLGMYKQAEEKFLRAQAIERKYGTLNDQLQTLILLAELYYKIKLYPEANRYLTRARIFLTEINNIKEKYNWLLLKGNISLEASQLDSARIYFRRLVQMVKENYYFDYRIKGLLGLGNIARQEQKLDSALFFGLLSEELAKKWPSYIQLFEVYNFLLEVYQELGQVEEVKKFYEKGIRLVRPYLTYASLTRAPENFYVEMKSFYKKYIRFLIKHENVYKAFYAYQDYHSLFFKGISDDIKFSRDDMEEIKSIHLKIEAMGKLLNSLSADKEKREFIKKRLRTYQIQLEEKWTAVRLKHFTEMQRKTHGFELEALQHNLSPNSVLLMPVLFSDSLIYFCLTRQALETIRLPASASWVKTYIPFLSTLIENTIYSQKTSDVKKHLNLYYQKIFEKIDHWLMQQGVSNIFFMVDEWLYAIPINILFDGHQYLTQKYKIAYFASPNFVKISEGKKKNFYQFLGIAPFIEELPASAKEIHAIAQNVNGNKALLLGSTATEGAFKRLSSSSKIIHLATHGQISFYQPEFSFLLFKSDQKDDGYFYLYELDSLNVSASLVNISACRLMERPLLSRSYPVVTSPAGFGYGFLSRGAKNVVLSPFYLHDDFARQFSEKLYAQMQNHSIGTAFQKTQQFFIERNVSPALWGNYIWLTNCMDFLEKSAL